MAEAEEVLAAQEREKRRERARLLAGLRTAALTPGERRRLESDFERAARAARFISNRGQGTD